MAISDLFLSVQVWVLLLVFLAALIYVYGTMPFRVWNELAVRGPAPKPFFGNMLEMFDDKIGFRESVRNWQNQYGRIFGIYFFRTPTLIVTDPDALKQIFVKDFNNFTDRFMVGNGYLQQRIINKGVFFERGVDWKRIRRIMTPTFSSGKLKLLTHHINLTAGRLGENLKQCAQEGKSVEAKKVFGAFTLDVICGTAFGLDTNSQQDFEGPFITHAKSLLTFEKILQVILSVAGVFPFVARVFSQFKIGFFKYKDVKFFDDNLCALIQEKKQNDENGKQLDFLDLLISAEADSTDGFVGERKLTTEEIAAQGIIFIIGGYETTSTTLQFLGYELAKHPEVQAKIVQEMENVLGDREPDYESCQSLKYLEAAINETLRMYPPVHMLSRLAERDTVLGDVTVPAKTAIVIPLSNIGRDPEFFREPDSFQPERFLDQKTKEKINPVTFLPFGFGPRSCIGLRLAMMELKIAVVHMLQNVKIVGVTPDVLDIEDYTGILVPRVPIRLDVQSAKY